MRDLIVSFASDADGSDILVPKGTARIEIRQCTPGKPGPPRLLFLDGFDGAFSVAPDATPDELRCLPSGHYRGLFKDASGKRIGQSFPFSIEHLGGPEKPSVEANDVRAVDALMQRHLDRLEAQNQKFLEMITELASVLIGVANKAMEAQQETVKVMPEAIKASARMVDASHGGTVVETVSTLEKINELMPSAGDSNLETVLNSPVVIGAAAALQKYMAKAAENGAESFASQSPAGESMAERAARLSAAADDRAARRAARG